MGGECSGLVFRQHDFVVGRERPLHLRPDVLIVLDDQQRRLRHRPSLTGRLTRNVVPFPTSLSTCMPPPCASNDRATLKQADAQSLFLRRLEWPEQRFLQKRRRHPAAVVHHRQQDAFALALRANVDDAVRADGVAGVEDQVGHDA